MTVYKGSIFHFFYIASLLVGSSYASESLPGSKHSVDDGHVEQSVVRSPVLDTKPPASVNSGISTNVVGAESALSRQESDDLLRDWEASDDSEDLAASVFAGGTADSGSVVGVPQATAIASAESDDNTSDFDVKSTSADSEHISQLLYRAFAIDEDVEALFMNSILRSVLGPTTQAAVCESKLQKLRQVVSKTMFLIVSKPNDRRSVDLLEQFVDNFLDEYKPIIQDKDRNQFTISTRAHALVLWAVSSAQHR